MQREWREQEEGERTQIMIITGGTQTLLVPGCTEREHGEQDPWHPGAAENMNLYHREGRVRAQDQRDEPEAMIEVTGPT